MKQTLAALFGAKPRLDEAEFERLFLDLYPRIAATAANLLGDPAEAEELALEAFWKLWQDPPQGFENLPGWLYRVTTHLAYNRLRSSRRRAGYETLAYQLDVQAQYGQDPEEEASRREEQARTRAILSRMSERDVQLLWLHASGFSYKEIAAAIGVNPGSIGVLLARAERKFESIFAHGEDHAPER